MTSKALYLAAGIGLLAGGLFLRGTASQQGTPAPPSVTLLLTLGQKATKLETWDGTAHISGGALVSTEGRHFSAGDSVTAPANGSASRGATRSLPTPISITPRCGRAISPRSCFIR